MIIKPNKHISYICPFCGKIVFASFSAFDICSEEKALVKCSCEMSEIRMSAGEKLYRISIPCFACEESHNYSLLISAVLGKLPTTVSCPESLLPVGCIGSYSEVNEWADMLEEIIDAVFDEMQDEEYFAIDSIMYQIIEHISTLVDQGRVECPCAGNDFEYVHTDSSVILYCCDCGAKKEIRAETNEDLKSIHECDKIVLQIPDKNDNIIRLSENIHKED